MVMWKSQHQQVDLQRSSDVERELVLDQAYPCHSGGDRNKHVKNFFGVSASSSTELRGVTS
eukprot:1077077-Amphidinium_carterae.1